MPEAITKYAVNSTLGTDEFEPLDKIIKSQRTYAASDDLLVILAQNLGQVPPLNFSIIENISFKAKVNGSLRVIFSVLNTSDYNGYFSANVYKNDSLLSSLPLKLLSTNGERDFSLDIPIEKGFKYTFSTRATNDDASVGFSFLQLNKIQLCGRIVDISMIEIGGDE